MSKCILLGAGFSYDLGMPLTNELTNIFLQILTEEKVPEFTKNLLMRHAHVTDRPINKEAIFEGINLYIEYKNSNGNNYEEFLSRLNELEENSNKTQSDKDSYHYLFNFFYDIIHNILTLYQITSYSIIYNRNYKWFSDLNNILSKNESWIFTLNHDLYMECLAIDLKIPISYGDINQISFPISNIDMENIVNLTYSNRDSLITENTGFFKEKFGINLVRLHGGLSELEYKDRTIICNQSLSMNNSSEFIKEFIKINAMGYYHQGKRLPVGRDWLITNSKGELDIICKSMLTGGRKYSLTTDFKKGEEKLKLFEDILRKIDELTIIGYGFGDYHINCRISNAMAINPNLKLKIVDPIHKSKPDFLRQFDYGNRIRGGMCGAAQWIYYVGNEIWNEDQIESLKKNERYRVEIKKIIESIFLK